MRLPDRGAGRSLGGSDRASAEGTDNTRESAYFVGRAQDPETGGAE